MGPRPGLKHSCWKCWCHGQSVMSFPRQRVLYCHPLTAASCRQRRRGSSPAMATADQDIWCILMFSSQPKRGGKTQNWGASTVVFMFFIMILPASARCVLKLYLLAMRQQTDNGIGWVSGLLFGGLPSSGINLVFDSCDMLVYLLYRLKITC